MFKEFLQFIEKQQLCRSEDNVLLAVSGGVDSMVMLDLFKRSGISLGVAHCNFRLRAQESDNDEDFVKKKAEQLGVNFHISRFNTREFAQEKGISVQMAARELRYNWFEEIREKEGYSQIATAHHHNDSIETVLFNLVKGTGLPGLKGIPLRNARIIRPLMFAWREEIEEYARRQKIEFREDSSNSELKYSRNLIRKKIIPVFEKINPGFEERLLASMERFEDIDKAFEFLVKKDQKDFIFSQGEDIYLKKSYFQHISILHQVLRDYHFNYDQSKQIHARKDTSIGALFHSPTHVLNIDREFLILSSHEENDDTGTIWKKGEDQVHVVGGILKKAKVDDVDTKLYKDSMVEFFDAQKLHFPLTVRNWKEGDWFIPLGMDGKKKLSDFMIDKKIAVNLKKRIMVLVSEGSIVWVIGHQIDDRYKVTKDTSEIIKIRYQPIHDQSF